MLGLLKTTSIACIVLGILAIIGSNGYVSAILGGLMFAGQGALTLAFINQYKF